MVKYRQRSNISWIVWSSAVVTLGVLMAWHFNWIPGGKGAVTQKLADAQREVPAEDKVEKAASSAKIDPIVFSEQSEPPVEEAAVGEPGGRLPEARTTNSSQRFLSRNQWNHPSQTVAPLSRPKLVTSRPGEVTQAKFEAPTQQTSSESEPEAPRGTQVELTSRRSSSGDAAGQDGSRPSTSRTVARAETSATGDVPALQEIDQLIADGKTIAAHRELSRLYWAKPSQRPAIQSRIDSTARLIYFSPTPHFMEPHVVGPSEPLSKIAAKYKVSWEFLGRLNRVDERRVQAGQKLKVISGPFSAIVDLSRFELTIHGHGYYVKRYQIGIGKDGATPVGKFVVKNKLVNPRYYGPDGMVIHEDDPLNPLGERWIDLGDSYGIHGTIEPKSIGKAESKGCVRMANGDIEEVYDFLTVGSEVEIRR